MNGEALPMLNGFPARLIVPGFFATYWVKSLDRITVLNSPTDAYWMTKAYKIPSNLKADETPERLAKDVRPIGRMNVRSFFVSPEPNAKVAVDRHCMLEGIAFDGGEGIQHVELSMNDGRTWKAARSRPGPWKIFVPPLEIQLGADRERKPILPRSRPTARASRNRTSRAGIEEDICATSSNVVNYM